MTRFHRSQLTQRDFATRHRIGYSTLSKWLRLERDAVPAKVKFQEVRLPNPTPRWPIEVVSPTAATMIIYRPRFVKPLVEYGAVGGGVSCETP